MHKLWRGSSSLGNPAAAWIDAKVPLLLLLHPMLSLRFSSPTSPLPPLRAPRTLTPPPPRLPRRGAPPPPSPVSSWLRGGDRRGLAAEAARNREKVGSLEKDDGQRRRRRREKRRRRRELKQLYRDKFFGESSEKMVEYLKTSVGIIHKNHAESITTFIKESVDKELREEDTQSDSKSLRKKRLTFCVEGNISVGKTTFLQRIANETLELRDLVEIVPEPIAKWQDVGPDHFNILDAFYAEPQRYAYTFQNYVFVTRVMQERESAGGVKPLRLMERSVFSDRMVFVRAVYEANWMNEMEISIYDSWFDPVVSCLPGLIPDGFIYLRASPDTCHKRMMLRKRAEEGGVSLDYLRGLHEKHESWLFPTKRGNHGVLSVSQLPLHMDNSLHPDIRDRVFYLEGDHMHSSIQKVPALVLDCEPNIDFSKDVEAKREYARQVAEFFEFVKKKKEASTEESASDGKAKGQQIVLPNSSGLWVPDHNHFPESALKSLDFRRAMSFLSG
uniref:Deoxynucleoside kinase domain-containing protein n=1 Tax=Ananas comosus var. bracteatus TaxID=296719 RepID=A0A6V7NHR3_ANACO|nr:unnamed protein product [Ananas comosus var. bracteatus]